MRSYKITIILILSLAILTQAGMFRLTLEGGMSTARWTDTYDEDYALSYNFGTAQGIGLGFGGGTHFQFNPEFLFVQKGAHSKGNLTRLQSRNTYFEVPILFRWYFGPPEGMIRGYVNIGPYFDFMISQRTEVSTDTSSTTLDLKSEYNTFDMGITFGAGFAVLAGPGRVILDFRYSMGTVDVHSSNSWFYDYATNRAFIFMVGYAAEFGAYDIDEDDDDDEDDD